VVSHEWRGSSPLGECHVTKVACSPSFKYSLMRGGQVAKEVRRRSSHVVLTWSGMWGLLGLVFPKWHFQR